MEYQRAIATSNIYQIWSNMSNATTCTLDCHLWLPYEFSKKYLKFGVGLKVNDHKVFRWSGLSSEGGLSSWWLKW